MSGAGDVDIAGVRSEGAEPLRALLREHVAALTADEEGGQGEPPRRCGVADDVMLELRL